MPTATYEIGRLSEAGSTDVAYLHVGLGEGPVYRIAPNGVQDIEVDNKFIDDLINFETGNVDNKVFNYATRNGVPTESILNNFGSENVKQIRFNGPITLKSGTESGIPATNVTFFPTTNTFVSKNSINSIRFKFTIEELKVEQNEVVEPGVVAVITNIHPRSETGDVDNTIASKETEVRAVIETPKNFDVEVKIPEASLDVNGYRVTVIKTTKDSNTSTNFSELVINGFDEIQNEKFAYPGTAQIGYAVRASKFREGNTPNFSTLLKGLLCKVPTNYNQPIIEDGTIDWRQVEVDDITQGYFLESSGTGAPNLQIANNPQIYKGVWDGTFTYKWTQNPAWIMYELISNTSFGLGIAESHIDKFNFYKAAQYYDACSEVNGTFQGVSGRADGTFRHKPYNTYTTIKQKLLGLSEGTPITERRYVCDLSIEENTSVIDVINAIAASCFTIPVKTFGKIRLNVDKPGQYPVHHFNETNIIDNSLNISGISYNDLISGVEVTYAEPANHFIAETISIDDPDLRDDIFPVERVEGYSLISTKRRSEATRFGQKVLARRKYARRRYVFGVAEEAEDLDIGDVVSFSQRVAGTSYGYGGQIRANSPVSSNNVIFLEHFTTPSIASSIFSANTNPLAVKVFKRSTNKVDTYLISNSNYLLQASGVASSGNDLINVVATHKWNRSNSSFVAISSFSSTDAPADGDMWALGEYNMADRFRSTTDKLLKIEAKEVSDDRVTTLSCTEYVSNVYIDSETLIGYTPFVYKDLSNQLLSPPPLRLDLSMQSYLTNEDVVHYDLIVGTEDNKTTFPNDIIQKLESYTTTNITTIEGFANGSTFQ